MTAVLAEECDDLARWLPAATALTACPDTGPTTGHGKPGSRPPWNPAAASAALDVHAGARRLEAALYAEVTGRPRRPRGGSDGNTLAAIRGIAALGVSAPHGTVQHAARVVAGWVTVIQQLPAVDTAPRWERIRRGPDGVPPCCPFCGCYTLRVAVRSGMVICVLPGCEDGDGNPPRGRMEVGRVSAQPCVTWSDGTVVSAP